MSKRSYPSIPSSEITPESVYLNRRQFMKLAAVAGGSALLAACNVQPASPTETALVTPTGANGLVDELGSPANTFAEITNYNNFYEFSMDKGAVARLAEDFPISPWQVDVTGLVHNPHVYDIDDLRKFPQE